MRFVDPLPLPEIARPVGRHELPGSAGTSVPLYRVAARAVSVRLHRDLPATPLWSYGGTVPGVLFDTRSGEGLAVEWSNQLPPRHILPIDHSLHGAEKTVPEVRSVVHLHGAKASPENDGYP